MSYGGGTRGLAWWAAAGAMAAYVATVAVAGIIGVHARALASSPAGVGRGEVTQLFTSAIPVSGTWWPATLLLAGSGLLAARNAGPLRAVVAGVIAHIAGTLIPYAALALVRTHSPHYWQRDWRAPDFGVSLVFGAWFALAAVSAPNLASGLAIALLAVALARPGMTLTGAEHACAIAIGALCGLRWTVSRPPRSRAPARLSR